jgi:hypothetical protein
MQQLAYQPWEFLLDLLNNISAFTGRSTGWRTNIEETPRIRALEAAPLHGGLKKLDI